MPDCPSCGLPPRIIKVHRKLTAQVAESAQRAKVARQELTEARRALRKQERQIERLLKRGDAAEVRAQAAQFERQQARQQVQQGVREAGALRQRLHANEARTGELMQQVEQFKQVFRGLRALMPKAER